MPAPLCPCCRLSSEELALFALVSQAFELRQTPYLHDAVEAIADWHDRRHLRRYERELEELAWLDSLEVLSDAA